MLPVSAVAAAVAGLIKCTIPPLPIRPLKFLFVVDAQTSPSAKTPLLIPRHAPHVGFVTQKLASIMSKENKYSNKNEYVTKREIIY